MTVNYFSFEAAARNVREAVAVKECKIAKNPELEEN